jgi:uncharacterized Zn finger protein
MTKRKDYGEVILTEKRISNSWWGQEWCKNIERYSNLMNRLERGRTYIRKNTVKSLIIQKNIAQSLVQGSNREPYNVTIFIETIKDDKYENILATCENTIESFESLMEGSFPIEYKEFFISENYGLFPDIDEIKYECSCMDYIQNRHMCKHIAATLYAIGNKLDTDPMIFFDLRGINLSEFSNKIIKKEQEFVWSNVNVNSERSVDSEDVTSLFGLEYDEVEDGLGLEISTEKYMDFDYDKTENSVEMDNNTMSTVEDVKESYVEDNGFDINDVISVFKKKSREIKNIFKDNRKK